MHFRYSFSHIDKNTLPLTGQGIIYIMPEIIRAADPR